jgi:hypothetical protein
MREALEGRIKEKAAKVREYRHAVSRVGLLIVVDRTLESGMLLWVEPVGTVDSKGFDAVYVQIYPLDVFRLG